MTPPPPLDPLVQASSLLAALAYVTPTGTLQKYLADPALRLGGRVELVWGPEEKETNRVFVVKTLDGDTPRYVVAVRGTVPDLRSLFENVDLSLVELPWKTSRYARARISEGVAMAVEHIQSLRGGTRSEGLVEFLAASEPGAEIAVTGHSQGGTVASVLSLWLNEALPGSGRRVIPLTFAAQTAGPASFAEAFDRTFDEGGRYYNELDVVPRTWAESTLATIADLYPGSGPKCDWMWRQVLKGLEDCVAGKGFEQPSRAYALPGRVYDERGLLAFADEMDAQHDHLLYAWLTGVPVSVIRVIEPGWQPPPHS